VFSAAHEAAENTATLWNEKKILTNLKILANEPQTVVRSTVIPADQNTVHNKDAKM
jgi:hypothetical protein